MSSYDHLRTRTAPVRPALVRREPRVLAGVARGLSVHLGGEVLAWRLVLVALSFVAGLGIALYVILALAMKKEGSLEASHSRVAPSLAETESRIRAERVSTKRPLLVTAAILGLAALGMLLVISGAFGTSRLMLPVLVILAGAGIAWSHPVEGEGTPVGFTIAGGIVAALGGLGLVASTMGWGTVESGIRVSVIVCAILALVLFPVLIQNRARFAEEREARIRESERADIAAHLHDSVLQTLALIRSRSHEPDEVASLARSQERDLRRYLYSSREDEEFSVAEQLRRDAVSIEERYRGEIDAVITGDCQPSQSATALVKATREALTNACKHAGGKVSLYAELSDDRCEVFVRDRGEGFDPVAIGADRAGIRDSIQARLAQVGGSAEIRSPLPSGGTEVRMRIETDHD